MDIIIVILSGISLLYYFYYNENRKIERYFYQNNKVLFTVLEVTSFIILTSLIYNIRFILFNYIKFINIK
jgi:hypothetical protein